VRQILYVQRDCDFSIQIGVLDGRLYQLSRLDFYHWARKQVRIGECGRSDPEILIYIDILYHSDSIC